VSDKGFKPKKLDRESLETPLEPQWRVMGPDAEHRLHEKSKAQYRRFRSFGARSRRRVRVYTLGTAIGFAAIAWLLIDASLRTIWVFGGVGAALGIVVAILRPTDYLCGLLYGMAGLAGYWWLRPGGGRVGVLMAMLTLLCFGTIGIACGRVEEFKRIDGDD
jgi:hypothetical protein